MIVGAVGGAVDCCNVDTYLFAITSHHWHAGSQLKILREHAQLNYESVRPRPSDETMLMTATAGDANDAARAGGGKTKSHRKRLFGRQALFPPVNRPSYMY